MKRSFTLVTVLGMTLLAANPRLAAEEPAKPSEEPTKASTQPPRDPLIFASPVHAGCYIAAPGQCKIHVEPLAINVVSGQKLVYFQLITIQSGTGTQRLIYDWRPDQSNPLPYLGTVVTPSLVTQDFAATCGSSYAISLQGKDSGDSSAYNLGLTGYFTCPSTVP